MTPEERCGRGGIFGYWEEEGDGNPFFVYTLDHLRDARAAYRRSTGVSRDHWHAVANDRITALVHNEGYVEVLNWDRGGKYLNRWDPPRNQFAGGFTFVLQKPIAWCTLWSYLPQGAVQKRIFGIGYAEKTTEFEGLRIRERIEAPPGDISALGCTTEIYSEKGLEEPLHLIHFWGINLHQMLPFPLMTGKIQKLAEAWRRHFSKKFGITLNTDANDKWISVEWKWQKGSSLPPPGKPSWFDYYPGNVFLTVHDAYPYTFVGDINEIYCHLLGGCISSRDTWGTLPHVDPKKRNVPVLAVLRKCVLMPGEPLTYHYTYGYGPKEEVLPKVRSISKQATTPKPRQPEIEFVSKSAPWLRRETKWHSYYLQANSCKQEYFDNFCVDQGSAYGMMHGAMGAHRDYAFTVMALIWYRPDLAKSMLEFSMRAQNAKTGALPYAHIGYGKVTGAGVHGQSSDLDLFLLWAAAEYLGATRDFSLLENELPYYPRSANCYGTGMEHLQRAFEHLIKDVGLGPHGLLRCGTGDWNDLLLAFSTKHYRTIRFGESTFNAGVAAFVLPQLAATIEDRAPEFAQALRSFADSQTKALRALWNGKWWARGFTGLGDHVLGEGQLFLDCQAFPTLAGLLSKQEAEALLHSIELLCVRGEPAGARCLFPLSKGWILRPGADTNGGIWAAIDAWIVWCAAAINPTWAWQFFQRTTLHHRSQVFPHVWYGIWSGPDAYNSSLHGQPGETFLHVVTPMTDFPIMNSNRHAGVLVDIIKLAGIQPKGKILHIDPKLPLDQFELNTPLLSLRYESPVFEGTYIPIVSECFSFRIRPPQQPPHNVLHVTCEGSTQQVTSSDGWFAFTIVGRAGEPITWSTNG